MTAADADWRVVPLNSKVHDRDAFSCGGPKGF